MNGRPKKCVQLWLDSGTRQGRGRRGQSEIYMTHPAVDAADIIMFIMKEDFTTPCYNYLCFRILLSLRSEARRCKAVATSGTSLATSLTPSATFATAYNSLRHSMCVTCVQILKRFYVGNLVKQVDFANRICFTNIVCSRVS